MNTARLSWLILALFLLAACITLGGIQGWAGIVAIVAAAILPDVALIGAFATQGRLRPDRVQFYNVLHSPILAITTIIGGTVLAVGTSLSMLLLIGLGWLTHISFDRAFGFGLREPDGSIRPVGARGART